MQKHIRRKIDLPDWFDLKQYMRSAKLNELEWLTQIYLRQLQHESQQSIYFTGIVHDWQPALETMGYVGPMKEISKQEIKLLYSYLDKTKWPPHSHLPGPLRGLVQFDLTATDDALHKSFEEWLENQRTVQNHPPRPHYTPAVFSRWGQNQVLAYMDLTYWGKLTGSNITNASMGEAIFPGISQGNAAARVTQTTRKNAEELLSPATLHGLLSQYSTKSGKSPKLPIFLDLNKLNSQYIKALTETSSISN